MTATWRMQRKHAFNLRIPASSKMRSAPEVWRRRCTERGGLQTRFRNKKPWSAPAPTRWANEFIDSREDVKTGYCTIPWVVCDLPDGSDVTVNAAYLELNEPV